MKSPVALFLAAFVWLSLAAGCGDKTDKDDKTEKSKQQPGKTTEPGGTPQHPESGDGENPISKVQDANNRLKSQNNLRMIGIAFFNFNDTYLAFPPPANLDTEGKPLLSWRVHLLPFLEQNDLYNQFHLDEPWDSEHNKALVAQIPDVYKVPGVSGLEEGQTLYLATGANTIFPPSTKRGTESLSGGVKMLQVSDGTSNTLTVVEASKDKAVIWTKPDDLPFDPAKPREGLGGVRPGGFLALRADASAFLVPANIDDTNLGRLFIRDDGEVVEIPE